MIIGGVGASQRAFKWRVPKRCSDREPIQPIEKLIFGGAEPILHLLDLVWLANGLFCGDLEFNLKSGHSCLSHLPFQREIPDLWAGLDEG